MVRSEMTEVSWGSEQDIGTTKERIGRVSLFGRAEEEP